MNTTLESWRDNGWLRPHAPTRMEIADLFAISARDLKDAQTAGLSTDWRFGIAYNAVLKLCTILVHAEGFRPEHTLSHFRAIAAIPVILGPERKADAEYLETCRRKRNVAEYDRVGVVSDSDAEELVDFVEELRVRVRRWLEDKHPELA